MISLKKRCRDELLHLALILSLLRVSPEISLENDPFGIVTDLDLNNGTTWRYINPNVLRSHYVHPKNLDSVLLNYEQEVFADLNLLGRYDRINIIQNQNITSYLLNVNNTTTNSDSSAPTQPLPPVHIPSNDQTPTIEGSSLNAAGIDIELTQEDMDLIEVLWKQDVDLGFSLEPIVDQEPEKPGENKVNDSVPTSGEDDIEKLKELAKINDESVNKVPEEEAKEIDPWVGLNYTIDTETGEYVIKEDLNEPVSGAAYSSSCDLPLEDLSLPLPEYLLEEALQLIGLDDETPETGVNAKEIENVSFAPDKQDVHPAEPVGTETAEISENLLLESVLPSADSNLAAPEKADSLLAGSQSPKEASTSEEAGKEVKLEDDLDILADMIQTSQFHHPHPHHRAFQGRMPFVRTMSMEQRWQDLANLLSLPNPSDSNAMPHPFSHHHALHNYSHPHSHNMGYGPDAARGVLLHNATLTPPMGDLNSSVPYANIGGTNLGNAVATSMNLTNSSEPMGESAPTPHYKVEPSHDIMYYQNGSEINQTDGFLSSILNDEDLQLMDMAMNEGMYTMRMLDGNNAITNLSMNGTGASSMSRADIERMDTSSDSAVSSMGSERVPSDGEWCDGGSDSGHTSGDQYVVDYHNTKYRPFDYSYTSRQHTNSLGSTESARLQPVAQKKHQMFGKRYFQEQGTTNSISQPPTPVKYEYKDPSSTPYHSPNHTEGAVGPKIPEMKYSCSMELARQSQLGRNPLDHIQHNHTYHLPSENAGAMQRPVSRDKLKGKKSDEEHLTRDEKKARALNVPISVDDIINLPMDEFNERLSKYDLSETQLSLIRDIRRRGKNKVAAQNCRKRKLDQILNLADEVKEIRDRKMRIANEHEYMMQECQRMKDKYQQLYRHVFQNLRDPDGNPYSPYQYSLQTSADGSILIVPRTNNSLSNSERKDPPPSQGHKE
ncbi:segmentation protein cap'n'collar isoform X2 [Agrilus planipennis]|uniref:Segmentation protein cap'n'collar isoform X2 n=1 Tax=Agrilus planipennis TaxID=224129 RepID=A0A1W4X3S6_AGRPL|nr:segmentation protein cap'n'collar isoform X2 [Agrilus planipennis]